MNWFDLIVKIVDEGVHYLFYVLLLSLIALLLPISVYDQFGALNLFRDIQGYLFIGMIGVSSVLVVKFARHSWGWFRKWSHPTSRILRLSPDAQTCLFAVYSLGEQFFNLPQSAPITVELTKHRMIKFVKELRVRNTDATVNHYKIVDSIWRALISNQSYLADNTATTYEKIILLSDNIRSINVR